MEDEAGVGKGSKVETGGPGMYEFGFKSLEDALTKKFDGVMDLLELEFKPEVLDNIEGGAGDLRGMFDACGSTGEASGSGGVQAELGLVKKESMVGTVLPPGAEKDIM